MKNDSERNNPVRLNLPDGFVPGNYYDKYRSTNPVAIHLMNGFFRSAKRLVQMASPNTIFEIGCGPGDFVSRLLDQKGLDQTSAAAYVGADVSKATVIEAKIQHPSLAFLTASTYALPFQNASFDLVIACEVLEHLDRPSEALRELRRICRSYLLVSVPWEPIWRISNILRGRYLNRLGDTPGHIQHFSREDLRRLVSADFLIKAEDHPFPWTMILACPIPELSGA